MGQPEAPGYQPGYGGNPSYGANPGYGGAPNTGAPSSGAPGYPGAPSSGAPGFPPAPSSGGAPGYGDPNATYPGAPSSGAPGFTGNPAYGPPPGYGGNSGFGGPPAPPPSGPQGPNRNVGLIVGAIVAAVVLIMIAGGVIAAVFISNRDEPSDDPTVSISDAAPSGGAPQSDSDAGSDPSTDSTAPTSGKGSIGKPIRQGDLVITVTGPPRCGVKTVGEGYGVYESQKGQFCLVDLKFENTGKKALKPKDFGTYLIDEQGGETYVDFSSYKANPDGKQPLFENIYPGKNAVGIIVFDIPADQKPAELKMNPVGDYSDEILISLK
jgi:hypothetical protein